MGIKVLDDITVNKIAAGEVIERPASALKELLENSADGGATKIEVAFQEGGKNFISVKDNGRGIAAQDLPLALQRHATSKIEKVEDLFSLSTMGFRGEALASIAAVSELKLSSTPTGEAKGAVIEAVGGQIGPVKPAPPLTGTQVEIKDLFYNVPARQKFLKSTGGETAALKKVFKNFALIHPHITLSLKQDQKQIYFYPAQNFFKRACDVLSVASSDTFELSISRDGFEMRALLVHPKLNIATQSGISIFVQDRPVQDKLITQAIIEGYRNLVMDHQFPQAVVALKVPPDFVDVNVHPAKLQVKFQQPSTVFRFVSSEIQNALSEKLEKSINPVAARIDYSAFPVQQEFVRDNTVQYHQKPREIYKPDENIIGSLEKLKVSNEDLKTEPQPLAATATWSGLQVIGQLANTYILTQSPKGLVIIDQHAAHERVLFERFKNNSQIEKQASLFDDLIELASEEVEAITSTQWIEEFQKWGFEFHARGVTTLAVTMRPAFLTDTALKPLIERLASQIVEAGSHGALESVVHDLWASMSCHGAIRAGKVLSGEEMKSLLNQMEEYSFSSFCPHGRPVSVQLGLYDLEKLFKRIV